MNYKNLTMVSLVIFTILISLVSSCGKKSFEQLLKAPAVPIQPGKPTVEICNRDPNLETDQLLVTFALDITGSNKGSDGSDPDRENRFGNLIKWIDKKLADAAASGTSLANERFALIEFSMQGNRLNGGAMPALGGATPAEDQIYYYPLDEFKNIVTAARGSSVDDNGTPYKNTLRDIQGVLEAEIQKQIEIYKKALEKDSKAKPTVFDALAIFLSDGQPCTADDGGVLGDYGQPSNAPQTCPQFGNVKSREIIEKVKYLVKDLPSHPIYGKFINTVTLNTGFYQKDSNANPYAARFLADMASTGLGYFFDFTGGAQIDYNQVVKVETRKIRWDIADWEIKNLNAIWDEDREEIQLDSDADGVADKFEWPLECINKYSCNGSGVRDGIYYQFLGKSCATKKVGGKEVCVEEKDALCQPGGKWIDADGDRLLQCEENKLGSNDEKFDTNNDLIVDDTAFYRRYQLTSEDETAGNPGTTDYDGDGINDYEEVTHLFTPRKIKNQELGDYKPVERVRVDSKFAEKGGIKCDYYEIKNMPILTPNKDDLIQITIVDKQNYGLGEKRLRIAVGKMKDGAINFTNKDFKEYNVK